MWIVTFLIIGLIVLIVVVNRNKKKEDKTINRSYLCDDGHFLINGQIDEFIISKNDKFEFLVKNGRIVSCKDKRVSGDFVNYGDVNK